jgi:hypothetical protein
MGIHYLQLGEPNRHILWIEDGPSISRILYSYGQPRAVVDQDDRGRITRYKSADYEARSTTRHIAWLHGGNRVYVLPQGFFSDPVLLSETPSERKARAERLCSIYGYTLESRLTQGEPEPDPEGEPDPDLCGDPDCPDCYPYR